MTGTNKKSKQLISNILSALGNGIKEEKTGVQIRYAILKELGICPRCEAAKVGGATYCKDCNRRMKNSRERGHVDAKTASECFEARLASEKLDEAISKIRLSDDFLSSSISELKEKNEAFRKSLERALVREEDRRDGITTESMREYFGGSLAGDGEE